MYMYFYSIFQQIVTKNTELSDDSATQFGGWPIKKYDSTYFQMPPAILSVHLMQVPRIGRLCYNVYVICYMFQWLLMSLLSTGMFHYNLLSHTKPNV